MPTVLITGAGRGLGHEFARQYAADGWAVLATCRDQAAADRLAELAGEIEIFELDVTDDKAVEAVKAAIGQRPIDVLINNAGLQHDEDGGLGDLDEAVWREVMAVNAFAPLRLTNAFADNVAASDHKRIVSITSQMGSIGSNQGGGHFAYRSSKAALNALMRGAAFELAPRGVTTIVVHPGWVQTDMGGRGASLTAEKSVVALRTLIERMSPRMNGRFYNYDGTEIGW